MSIQIVCVTMLVEMHTKILSCHSYAVIPNLPPLDHHWLLQSMTLHGLREEEVHVGVVLLEDLGSEN